jgi:hypothetical protein
VTSSYRGKVIIPVSLSHYEETLVIEVEEDVLMIRAGNLSGRAQIRHCVAGDEDLAAVWIDTDTRGLIVLVQTVQAPMPSPNCGKISYFDLVQKDVIGKRVASE